jgi:hypothetical protein
MRWRTSWKRQDVRIVARAMPRRITPSAGWTEPLGQSRHCLCSFRALTGGSASLDFARDAPPPAKFFRPVGPELSSRLRPSLSAVGWEKPPTGAVSRRSSRNSFPVGHRSSADSSHLTDSPPSWVMPTRSDNQVPQGRQEVSRPEYRAIADTSIRPENQVPEGRQEGSRPEYRAIADTSIRPEKQVPEGRKSLAGGGASTAQPCAAEPPVSGPRPTERVPGPARGIDPTRDEVANFVEEAGRANCCTRNPATTRQKQSCDNPPENHTIGRPDQPSRPLAALARPVPRRWRVRFHRPAVTRADAVLQCPPETNCQLPRGLGWGFSGRQP